MVEEGADLEMALFLAVVNGDRQGVKAALEAGADQDKAEDASEMRPIDWAVRMGHAGCVDELLAAGGDPWSEPGKESMSAIGCAMKFRRWDMLPQLVEGSKSRPSMTPSRLEKAWKAATWAANMPAMKLFLSLGVDIDAPLKLAGMPALAVAVSHKMDASVAALLSLGADPCAVHVVAGQASCPVLIAVERSWPEGVRKLVAGRAALHGPEGRESLGMALIGRRHPGPNDGEVLSVLQEAGADLLSEEAGGALLCEAVWRENVGAAAWLCERGVDPAAMLAGRQCALEVAREHPDRPCSQLIEAFALLLRERRELEAAAGAARLGAPSAKRV